MVRQESTFMRQLLMHEMCYATEKMGVGPPGFVLQDAIPNHHKLLWSKATVVSVMGKGEARLRQVRAKEMNETEPMLTCRKLDDVIKTRFAEGIWDKSGGYPVY